MDPFLYQRLVDLLDLLVSRLETDNIDYEPMLASFANNTEQHIMSLEDTNSISTSEAPPRDLSPESDMHTITRFKGKFDIPEISRTERLENKLESKDQSFLPLALPIIPILFPFIPPIFFPETRRTRPKPKPNVRPVVQPDVITNPVQEYDREWEHQPDPWTVPIPDLKKLRDWLGKRGKELSDMYPETLPGKILTAGAAVAIIATAYHYLKSKPFGPISAFLAGIGLLTATANAAEEIDLESQEERVERIRSLGEYVDIYDKIIELDSIIKWRESNEGKTEGLGDLAGGFALDKHRDTLREIEATTQYTLPPQSQEAIDNEYYDRWDWFYDFKNGWPTIRDIMFIGKQIDPSKAPEDLRNAASNFSDTTTTFYKIVPSAVYKRLEEETIAGNPNSARKLSKILAAKKYFSDDRYRYGASGKYRADKIPGDLLIRREYYSIGRHYDESYVLTTGDDLAQPEIDIDNLQPRDHKEITRHLSEIVKIEPPIISPTSPQQQSYEEVNKLLEEYILLSKKNKSTKDTLIKDIKSISNQ